jgi:hypothetical protein
MRSHRLCICEIARYLPVWRCCIRQSATADTRPMITSNHCILTTKPRLKCSMSLESKESLIVMLWAKGSKYAIKECFSYSGAKATT